VPPLLEVDSLEFFNRWVMVLTAHTYISANNLLGFRPLSVTANDWVGSMTQLNVILPSEIEERNRLQ
jgi:hypothetical protein